jgi:hypothetical protein
MLVHPVMPAALSAPIEIGFPATEYYGLICLKKQAISSLNGGPRPKNLT